MTNKEFIQRFCEDNISIKGKKYDWYETTNGNLWVAGNSEYRRLYSYNTCICEIYNNNCNVIVNITKYSFTTTKIQNMLNSIVSQFFDNIEYIDNISRNIVKLKEI